MPLASVNRVFPVIVSCYRAARLTRSGSKRLLGTDSPTGEGRAANGSLPVGWLLMAVGRSGYCGLVRLENGLIDLAAAVSPNVR